VAPDAGIQDESDGVARQESDSSSEEGIAFGGSSARVLLDDGAELSDVGEGRYCPVEAEADGHGDL
jgi:hypothetical protein